MATTNKYDRQLRLWGSSGQRALGNSCVVLFRATSAGTETLKNLVLPGVGRFRVVDEGYVTGDGREVFSNFFVFGERGSSKEGTAPTCTATTATAKRTRAEVAATNLAELNPDASGTSQTVPSLTECDFASVLNPIRPSSSEGKLLVVAADLPPDALVRLSEVCASRNLYLLIVRSYGLVGEVRVQVPPCGHPVIESKPDSSVPDLRIAVDKGGLFPALKELVEGYGDLSPMKEGLSHGHVPYVVILIKAMERWRKEHGNEEGLPKTMEEKESFKAVVKSMSKKVAALKLWRKAERDKASASSMDVDPEDNGDDGAAATAAEVAEEEEAEDDLGPVPTSPEELEAYDSILKGLEGGAYDAELNYEEALSNAYLAYAPRELPWEVRELLDDAAGNDSASIFVSESNPKNSARFNLLLLALKNFLEKNDGSLPLDGSVPDMASGTEEYVALQGAYQIEAKRGLEEMRSIVGEISAEVTSQGKGSAPVVTDEQLKVFCKNVCNLRLLKTRSYAEEFRSHSGAAAATTAALAAAGGGESAHATDMDTDDDGKEIASDLSMACMDPYRVPDQTPLLFHAALRAADLFQQKEGRYPGTGEQCDLSSDSEAVHSLLVSVVRSMGIAETDLVKEHILNDPDKRHAREITRYGDAEIHNVASVIGGVASQEAVKLIAGQYVPVDDAYVYNGVCGVGGVYRF